MELTFKLKMKKILGIIVLGLLWSSFALAVKIEMMPEGTSVNSLLKDGWKLHSTDVASDSGQVGLFYNLIKGKNIITCGLTDGTVQCFKP